MATASAPTGAARSEAPDRASIVLVALILVAAVANLNLAVANVALPDIGKAFDSSQTMLDLIAVGYSLGLAASVLYLGAVGDRYGRKTLLIAGTALAVPASLVAAWAPSDIVLFAARVVGGLAAGMAYPTTLALITALWSGPGRTKSIALWSALGGAISALGPLTSGFLLQHFWWGSVFLVTLPLAVVALVLAVLYVPAHVNEATEPIDNLGGVLSVVMIAAMVLAINFAAVPDRGTLAIGLGLIALAALGAFILRQRRAANPLFDLDVAARRIFWVAACAGIVVFGSLDGGHVRRPAVPAERPGLRPARGRRVDPPGRLLHGADRASVGQARRDEGCPVHAARRLRVRAARVPHDAAAVERRHQLLAGRPRLRAGRRRCRLRRHAGVALAHRFGAGAAGRHGLGHRRPPARSRRGDHAVDPGGTAHRRVRRAR